MSAPTLIVLAICIAGPVPIDLPNITMLFNGIFWFSTKNLITVSASSIIAYAEGEPL